LLETEILQPELKLQEEIPSAKPNMKYPILYKLLKNSLKKYQIYLNCTLSMWICPLTKKILFKKLRNVQSLKEFVELLRQLLRRLQFSYYLGRKQRRRQVQV